MKVDRDHWLYTRQIAHRGLHNAEYPENTPGSFVRAIDMGYAIETDIRLTADGVVAVFHDGELSRATGGKDKREISQLTCDELKAVPLFGCDAYAPTFEELLNLVAGRVPLLIELKRSPGGEPALEAKAAQLLDGYRGEFAVQSFNPYVLTWFKDNRPDFLRGQLSSFFEGDESMSCFRRFALKRMIFNGRNLPDFISYYKNNLPNPYVDKYVKKHNVPVLAWTVTCPHCLAKVKGHCDNIIFEGFVPPAKWDE